MTEIRFQCFISSSAILQSVALTRIMEKGVTKSLKTAYFEAFTTWAVITVSDETGDTEVRI